MAAVRMGTTAPEKEAILLPVTECQGAIRESRKMQHWVSRVCARPEQAVGRRAREELQMSPRMIPTHRLD